MSRAREPGGRAQRVRGSRILAAVATLGALALLLALLDRSHAPWGFLLASLALVGGAGALAGHQFARRQAAESLHDARQQVQLLRQLSEVWHWQTDAEHRLQRLQPPQGAPASAWADGAAPGAQALWDRFETRDGTSLQALLQAQAPLADVAAWRVGPQGLTPWRLRGVPRFDAQGRFAGHLGSARPVDDELAQQADRLALQGLLHAWPGPLWIGGRDPLGGAWTVRLANDAARRFGGAPPLGWEAMLAGLPDELGTVAAALAPGATTSQGDWTLVSAELGDDAAAGGAGARLFGLLPRGDDAAASDTAAEQAAFSYTVSHDLRAPIRVVEGFTRIVKEDYGRLLDRIGNDHLDRVLGAAARMNHMIDALLSLAQLSSQPLARQPVNLSQLAGFVLDDLRRQQPEHRCSVQVAPGLQAQGDPTLLRLVLENLLGNAWKYSARAPHPEIAFESQAQDGRTVFVVRDNGAGFDMRFADRLFGVFQRLHSANDFQGTGVGLASVKRIVARHGGAVWAEGEVGRGARFYFTLGG